MANNLYETSSAIGGIVKYALGRGLIPPEDAAYTKNRILEALRLDSFDTAAEPADAPLDDMLAVLADASGAQSADARDRADAAVMGCVTPPPSAVTAKFRELYAEPGPRAAADMFYRLARDTNYIRAARVARDIRWTSPSRYGQLELSVNLAKPEKDPRDIAAAAAADSGYPACQLCAENEGYPGRPGHPARQNLRIVPLTLGGEEWGLQFSPYVYYDEHCIVLAREHRPMSIDGACFRRLCEFTDIFPHWFVGSNADLPVVGGSILSHEHFQGGRHCFPMERAAELERFTVRGAEACALDWPLAVIRLRAADADTLCSAADKVLAQWRAYSDPAAGIRAKTGNIPHNTVTPIARRRGGLYELDLALRNNRTDAAHPLGIFHPHAERHHIKKENIGLIEVMGLAVLPARLARELDALAEAMPAGRLDAPEAMPHREWAREILLRREVTRENVRDVLREETARVFTGCLEDAGVFGSDGARGAGFRRFIDTLA